MKILLIIITLTLLLLLNTAIHPVHIVIKGTNDPNHPITLPLIQHSNLENNQSKAYTISGDFHVSQLSQHSFNIVPDDCLTYLRINGKKIDLQQLLHGNTCDYVQGFDIDLNKYLKQGNNTFEIGIKDFGGTFGLSIKSSKYDVLYLILIAALVIECTSFLYLLLQYKLHLPKVIILIFIIGFILRILYLSYTPFNQRANDVMEYTGHLDYIRYVGDNLRLPQADKGWEFHQAPLYYIITAVIYKTAANLTLDYPFLLQLVSFTFSIIGILFGVFTLKILFPKKPAWITASALLVFLPTEIMSTSRIGNDPIAYMLSSIVLYYMLLWDVKKQNKYFYLAGMCIAILLMTKLSGIILATIFILISIYNFTINKKILRKSKFKISLIILLLLLATIPGFLRNILTATTNKNFNILNGSSATSMNGKLAVKNNLNNFLYLDEKIFLTIPFNDNWEDTNGRQYFWNYFLKSILFSEFSFVPPIQIFLAKALSLILLQMIIFFCVGSIRCLKKISVPNLLLFLYMLLSIISLINYRHTYSFAPNADIRLILPAIIPIIYFFVSGIDFFMESKLKIIGALGYILSLVFCLASIGFILAPLFA